MTDSAAPTTAPITASEDVLRRSREAVAGVSTGVFVDGEWTEAASGRRFDVVDPATEEVVATVADGGPEDAVRAIEAAGPRRTGRGPRPASAARSCAAPTTSSWPAGTSSRW